MPSDPYTTAANAVRERLPADPTPRDFARYATLAANSHNTQPWTFRIDRNAIEIHPDFTRRTPVVDPDDHHLYVSLGCATENLVVAARAHGRSAEVTVRRAPSGDYFVRATLGAGPVSDVDLCDAIPKRQSTKSDYDGSVLTQDELKQLAASACHDGVDVIFLTDRPKLDEALGFLTAGSDAQVDDPNFVSELKHWIRFNRGAAIRSGDGLSGPTSGNPSLPDWIGPVIFGLVFRKSSEARKLASQIASSAGLVVFVARDETPEGWIEVGRCFERFALKATTLGVRHAHVNMPIEVTSIRPEFANWLGLPNRRPDLIIRFGHAAAMPMSLRRPVDDVIVAN